MIFVVLGRANAEHLHEFDHFLLANGSWSVFIEFLENLLEYFVGDVFAHDLFNIFFGFLEIEFAAIVSVKLLKNFVNHSLLG